VDDETEAREAFERGRQAYVEDRFEDAVAALRRSMVLSPRLATAFNLTVALEAAGHIAPAANFAMRILREDFGEAETAQRLQVEELLRALDLRLGVLSFTVRGATEPTLEVDAGSAQPLRGELRVVPGPHRLVISEDDRSRVYEVEVLAGDRRDVLVDLSPATGELEVRGPSAESEVEIVDVGRGLGVLRRTLSVGSYDVQLVRDPASRRPVEVLADELTRVVLAPTSAFDEERSRNLTWLWVVGAVLVAGAVGTGLYYLLRPESEVQPDPVFGIIEALSWR
jgi:hypothetical protein